MISFFSERGYQLADYRGARPQIKLRLHSLCLSGVMKDSLQMTCKWHNL